MIEPLPDNSVIRSLVIAEARLWLGTPYRHQASCRGSGADCLGLVRGIWRTVYGREPEALPAYASDWAEAGGSETLLAAASRHMIRIEPADKQAGDVLVFRWRPHLPAKHVGILMPDHQLCHAYQAAGSVAQGPFAAAWQARIAAVFAFPAITSALPKIPPAVASITSGVR